MVKPKKHLGQHFLTDQRVAQRISECLHYGSGDHILEIGPGKGILTRFILDKKVELKAIELDTESVEYLETNFPNLEVLNMDFLKIDFDKVFSGSEFKIIGNFPYNISSQIVFKILENANLIPQMGGMFQKEVAKRICSEPGTKDYGILSVLTQLMYETEYLFTVNEGVFFPPPKVKSGVIRITRKEDRVSDSEFGRIRTLVKMAFNQRRKQLRNSIKSMLPENFESELLSKRPEQLHFTDFQRLAAELNTK